METGERYNPKSVDYPDFTFEISDACVDSYDDGYKDGYKDGEDSMRNSVFNTLIKTDFAAAQIGQIQSSGKSSKGVPGGMFWVSSPLSGSYT